MASPQYTHPPSCRLLEAANDETPAHDERETSDGYAGVLCHFSARWRLSIAADNSQWIFQYLESSHDAPWRGTKYFTTKKALLAAHGALKLPYDPKVAEVLKALPEHVSQFAKK